MVSSDLRAGMTESADHRTANHTAWPVLDPLATSVRPNLGDYDRARAAFSWDEAARGLDGLPGGGLNIAHERSTGTLRAHAGTRSPCGSSGRTWTCSI